MAKLQPLLNHCKFFMKCVFVLSFYNALYCRFLYAPLCRVFAIGPHMLCHQAEEPSPNTPVHRQIATNIYVSLTLKSCTYIFICHDAVRYRAETNMKFKVQIF